MPGQKQRFEKGKRKHFEELPRVEVKNEQIQRLGRKETEIAYK